MRGNRHRKTDALVTNSNRLHQVGAFRGAEAMSTSATRAYRRLGVCVLRTSEMVRRAPVDENVIRASIAGTRETPRRLRLPSHNVAAISTELTKSGLAPTVGLWTPGSGPVLGWIRSCRWK
jgi:hypothetical protein